MKIKTIITYLFGGLFILGIDILYIQYENYQNSKDKAFEENIAQKKQDLVWSKQNKNTPWQGDTVSFCITHLDRFQQISKTLPKNLEDNRQDQKFVEFIVVDFSPKDSSLKDFIFKNFENDLKSGYLKYYQTDKMPFWNAMIAKNTAHYQANNKIVVNLDCDNYTGFRGGLYVARLVKPKTILWQASWDVMNGSWGRIALYKKDFDELGGYDESLPEPTGNEDNDLLNRGYLKLKALRDYGHAYAIRNSIEEKMKHTHSRHNFDDMNSLNKEYSDKNIQANKYKANNGIYGIRNKVIRIYARK